MKTDFRLPAAGPRPPASDAGPAALAPAPRRPSSAPIASEDLFAGASEVQISHRGSLYRLKQTALGKLILTK